VVSVGRLAQREHVEGDARRTYAEGSDLAVGPVGRFCVLSFFDVCVGQVIYWVRCCGVLAERRRQYQRVASKMGRSAIWVMVL